MNLHQLTKLSRCLQWYFLSTAGTNYVELQNYLKGSTFRSSRREVLLKEGVLKLCSIFTGERTYRSVISIKLLSNFIEITLWHGCSPVHLLHIFRAPFSKNTSGRLLLNLVVNVSSFKEEGVENQVVTCPSLWFLYLCKIFSFLNKPTH